MQKHDPLWEGINTLLAHLRSFHAVALVSNHYWLCGNPAPGELLNRKMDDLQKRLDVALEMT